MTGLLSSGTRVTLASTSTRTARSSRQTTSFITSAAPPAPVMAVSIKLSLGGTERGAPTRYRLLGSVTGVDISSGITIPVTDTPGNGIIVVAWAGGNRDTAYGDQFHISAATDPSGFPWSIAHTGANVGAVIDAAEGTYPVCEAGSVTRACVTGDLAPGDTIHLTENVSSFPTTATYAAVAVFIPGVANAAGAWEDPLGSGPFVDYGNGDFISTRSPDGKTLSFGVDWDTHPYPVNDSLMLTVSASNPGYPWTPFTFSKLAEAIPAVGGGVQVALSAGVVAASTTRECGGAFSSVTEVGTLGFQFVTEPAPASVLTIQLPN